MGVNPVVASDPAKLAAGTTNGPLDTSVATRIADLATASAGPLATFRNFIAGLGSQVRLSQQQAEVQVGVLSQVDTARAAARGVSIDEEVASIVEFQRAYEASAKVIQVFDSTMDALMSIVR
jgi:flagellar hook-associated protein 1 FlgK